MGVEGQAIVLDAKISLTNINPVNCLGWAVSREMPKTSYIATGHLRGEPLGGGGHITKHTMHDTIHIGSCIKSIIMEVTLTCNTLFNVKCYTLFNNNTPHSDQS